ncbi:MULTISPECIES: DUF305 domain-containing protein [Streptomyces]|uniref:DUF305 domain-containing protein n=1 Tax=Streptomyces spororaveus TaxID=284039 RepID=A0ABQ3TJ76_9ACTN|nr:MULTISPECIES: DUF305 domain-containing protein [Streptomyces]MCM9079225.1 DUF305 domain-containing protein [Streptomyces spororaveus]MCX5306351.1 DUF305 domain-containing protein [Streptomyces sp. NBC_00160]GHI80446.1 DUF305 domain-containing protein [Streptomyces spororaveus]
MSRATGPVRPVPRTYWVAGTAVLLALLFAAAATVAAANGGGSAGPGVPAAGPRTPGLKSPDAGFARDMAVHHQQAVEMSFIVRDRTQDEPVRTLAYDIANTQANQRGMLLGWLDLWGLPKVVAGEAPMSWMGASGGHGGHVGHGADAGAGAARPGALMPGMATREELDQLGAASGRDAEVLFLQLMTDHHKGGVAMAEGCAQQCETPVERELAQGMVDAQRSELTLMADMLRQRGAAPRG